MKRKMDFQGKNDAHDALDEILRRYLAEHDVAAPDGESLMEMAANSVLSQPPKVTPSAEKEAEMIARLQAQFPEGPQPGPAGPGVGLKYGLLGIGVFAVLTLAILLFVNPFSTESTPLHDVQGTENTFGKAHALADDPGDFAHVDAATDDLSSLHGDGNSESSLFPKEEIGTGKGNQGRPNGWVPNRNVSVKGSMRPDYPTASITPPVTITNPVYEMPARDLDPFPLRELYSQTATPSTYYQLDPTNDHLLLCSRGTVLHIPKNAFVDASSGESVTQTVQVELKEVYNRSDYLNSNLPTVSNGQQLIAGGAVYIDAMAAGRRLKLAAGKDIYVEFAHQKDVETHDMELYHGDFNEKGELNLAPAGGRRKEMVMMPIENLYFDEFWCDCDGEKYWNTLIKQVALYPEFSNSWVATREFRQRMRVLRDMGYYEAGFATYLDNIDKELWKVDQMVAEKLVEDAKGRKSQDAEIAYFHTFAQQMLTFTENYNDFGLDLTKSDARRQLLYRKVSREETERLIRLAKLRQLFVEQLESNLILKNNGGIRFFDGVRKGRFQKAGTELVAGYLIQELGWNTLNKVAANEFAGNKNREIKVRLTGKVAYESTRAFIAFTDIKSIMPGKPTTGQLHRFARVPENVDGWIVVIGFKNIMPYIGLMRLPQDDGDKIVQVTMEETRFDAYLSALRALD
jgi:hypothetical protein